MPMVGLYTDQLYALKPENGKPVLTPKNKLPISIVGREHCFECVKVLPIGKLNEANKAASMMPNPAPFDGKVFYLANSVGPDKTQVTFFVIKQNVYEKLKASSWVILPESLLIASELIKSSSNVKGRYSIGTRQLDAYIVDGAFKSIVVDENDFLVQLANSQSGNIETSINKKDQQYVYSLLLAFAKLPAKSYGDALNKARAKQLFGLIPYKLLGATVAATLTVYLAFSSLWLSWQLSDVEQQLSEQQNNLNEVFKLQKSLNAEQDFYRALATNSRVTEVTSPVWAHVLGLVGSNTEVLSARYENNQFSLRLKAAKATEAMGVLSENRSLLLPQMTSSVTKSRGKEIFSVQFGLKTDDALLVDDRAGNASESKIEKSDKTSTKAQESANVVPKGVGGNHVSAE